jgi:copper chaperone CopZ
MRRSASEILVVMALSAALGCSQSPSADDNDLTSAEAAALVAPETERLKEQAEKSAVEAAETEATPVVFNAEGAPTVEFSVPDMMCEDSCVPTVRETLAKQPGVKDVKVELATKTATVAVDKDAFDADAAVAALVDLQFTQTKLASPPAEKAHN